MFIHSAPASLTASTISAMYSGSVRVASIGENIGIAPASATRSTHWTARSRTSSRVVCIESSICTSLVEAKTCTISAPVSSAVSTSLSTIRAKAQVVELVDSAMSRTAANSASPLAGKPASMTWVPISSSIDAISRFSSGENEVRGVCSPSRRVVSKIRTDSISSVWANVPSKNSTPPFGGHVVV